MTIRTITEPELLKLWREREMLFPAFVRRMTPDDLDRASGAWDRHVAICEGRLVQ